MVRMDFQRREVALKLVYYGPPLSGKTTNLQRLHERIDPRVRGRLVTLDTQDDRTLYFDLLPLVVRASSGLTLRVQLFTVPGQVRHDTTRKLVLQGCDGVVFVADARRSEARQNNASFANLKLNLRQNGLDPARVPTVIQLNKQDLPDARGDDELEKLSRRGPEPIYKASALEGRGVVETFFGLMELAWHRLDQEHELERNFGVSRAGVFDALLAQLSAAALAVRV